MAAPPWRPENSSEWIEVEKDLAVFKQSKAWRLLHTLLQEKRQAFLNTLLEETSSIDKIRYAQGGSSAFAYAILLVTEKIAAMADAAIKKER